MMMMMMMMVVVVVLGKPEGRKTGINYHERWTPDGHGWMLCCWRLNRYLPAGTWRCIFKQIHPSVWSINTATTKQVRFGTVSASAFPSALSDGWWMMVLMRRKQNADDVRWKLIATHPLRWVLQNRLRRGLWVCMQENASSGDVWTLRFHAPLMGFGGFHLALIWLIELNS